MEVGSRPLRLVGSAKFWIGAFVLFVSLMVVYLAARPVADAIVDKVQSGFAKAKGAVTSGGAPAADSGGLFGGL
jgi:hypothetical protein